jgi:hypothetical protein
LSHGNRGLLPIIIANSTRPNRTPPTPMSVFLRSTIFPSTLFITSKGSYLPSRGASQDHAHVPLCRFGTPKAEFLVLHAVFRRDRAGRADAAPVFRVAHETPAGCAEDEFAAFFGTAGIGRAGRASAFPACQFHSGLLLFWCQLVPSLDHLFELIHCSPVL